LPEFPEPELPELPEFPEPELPELPEFELDGRDTLHAASAESASF